MNIYSRIKFNRILTYTLIALVVLVGGYFITSNVFGLFGNSSYEAADGIDYPDWPVFNIQKKITNSDQKFDLNNNNVVNIEIVVTGTSGVDFTLKDEPLGNSPYDKGISCVADRNLDNIQVTNFSGSMTISYSCLLSDDDTNINSNDLPEIVVGQTTLSYLYTPTDNTEPYLIYYYGGFRGNEGVINFLTQDNDSSDKIGLSGNSLLSTDCPTNTSCFGLEPSDTIFDLLRGRTFVGDYPSLELATLFYPVGMIMGDTYNVDPNNFYRYGRNLQQSSGAGCVGAGCASWVVSGSEIQSDVQAYYDPGTGFVSNFQENLKTESDLISVSEFNTKLRDSSRWYLEAENVDEFNDNNLNIFPDGKSWLIEDGVVLDFASSRLTHYYEGIGTIFINGDLIIKEDILPDNQTRDFLGLVVTGDVKIENGADVDAVIICGGELSTNGVSRSQLTGSFVAGNFDFNTAGTIIRYRIGLENHWPPGFRYIKMPVPEKSY